MLKLVSETLIRSKPQTVYDIIADVDGYAAWNPFNIRGSGGPAAEGKTIGVTVKLGKRTVNVRHKILRMKPAETFTWCDFGWFTKLAYGERTRTLSPEAGGVRYHVELTVTGPLAWLVELQFGKAMREGMKAETEALKRFAEAK